MLARTTRYNENLREYFYDKLSLLNRCEIKGHKAVDCIIHGIIDKSVRNGAQALNCKEPEDLLGFLVSQRPTDSTFAKRRNHNTPVNRPIPVSTVNDNSVICFNYRSNGHAYYKCPIPLTKCQKCSRVGHGSAACKLTPLISRPFSVSKTGSDDLKVLTICTTNNSNDKFYKRAIVNGHDLVSFIDFGSECSLIRESDAAQLKLPRILSSLPVIRGFGNSFVNPVYRSLVTIKLDDVEAAIEVLVVNDEFLKTPVLIGQDFTELPSVSVLKDANQQTGPQSSTLENADSKSDNFPPGDANSNISLTNLPSASNKNTQPPYKHDANQTTTVSKASPKSEDDFDVNEYFARLQGTRYVSAPLNSLTNEQKTNLDATEDNLEEINLNEPEKVPNVEVQQSLTADIAQNFSQLPTVLPQVASAVFSSFSSMLSMKSREQTPDDRGPKADQYQEVQFSGPADVGVSLMGVDEPSAPKEVAPPPREMAVGGTSNYRITTKKKAYAQIPGLSSTHAAPHNPPLNTTPFSFNLDNSNFAPQKTLTNFIINDNPENKTNLPITQSQINTVVVSENIDLRSQPPSHSGIERPHIAISSYTKEYNLFTPSAVPENNQLVNTEVTQREYNMFNPTTADIENTQPKIETNLFADKPSNSFTTVEQSLDQQTQSGNNAAIIPPPPMFSNVQKNDNQANVKSVLPPSVARRIGSNHPIIKPQTLPTTLVQKDNIFVPAPTSEEVPKTDSKQIVPQTIKHNPPAPIGSAFVQFSTTSPTSEKALPGQTPGNMPSSHPLAHVPLTSNPSSVNMLPPSLFKPDLPSEFNLPNQTASIPFEFPPASIPKSEPVAPPPMFFNPSNLSAPTLLPLETGSVPQSYAAEKPPANIAQLPPPLTFFNPSSTTQVSAEPHASPYNIHLSFEQSTQEATKPVPEPPKLSGSLNYRMQKKRPQYYSGPIEGVGAISNNVKPIVPALEPSVFKGALFTPETIEPAQDQPLLNINPPVIPQPTITPPQYPQFDINTQTQIYHGTDYSTAFDMSRQATDSYEPPKQEAKGFGIIGSLKSKLSSLDINKIQNTVTTFFDPAYNDTKEGRKEETNLQTMGQYNNPNIPYEYNRNDESTMEVFVSSLDQTNPMYNQNFGPCHQDPYNYGQTSQYYKQQPYDYSSTGFGQNVLPPHNYGLTSANTDDSKGYSSQQLPQTEILTQTETSEADAILTETPEEIISGSGNHGVIGSIAAPSSSSESRVASLFNYENRYDNQKREFRTIGLAEAAFFDNQPFDLSNAVHSDDLNKKLEKLHIAQEKEEDILLETKMLPDNLVSEIFSNEVDSVPIKDYPQTTVTGNYFTNFPSENSKNAGYLDDFLGANQSDADIGGYGSSYFQSGNDYKDALKKEEILESIPFIDPTTTPLFGLPNILAEVSKPLSDFKSEIRSAPFVGAVKEKKDDMPVKSETFTLSTTVESQQKLNDSDTLSIRGSCREVNTVEETEVEDLTSQLIENITAPIQLSNPVVAPLTESNTANIDTAFETKQCAEISHITEETIEAIQVQSATELLDDENRVRNVSILNYGWNTAVDAPFNPPEVPLAHDYNFKIDPTAVGFFNSNSSLFLDDIPSNASDELKAEFKSSHEETPPFIQHQMSIPSAPPAEDDDTKSDETGGLDVHSIEQDAKKDFPIYEEFVIEPSETDDDKIEYREREKPSEDPAQDVDSFTNRVERFKMMEDDKCDDVFSIQKNQLFDMNNAASPAITIASYFDTGNYAADTHYRNSISSPSGPLNIGPTNDPMRIPPGFEEDYKRRMSELSARNYDTKSDKDDNVPYIPETSTQTRPVITTTYSMVSNNPVDVTVTSTLVTTTITQAMPHPATIELQASVAESTVKAPTPVITKLPEFSSVFGQKLESGDNLASSLFNKSDTDMGTAFEVAEKIEPVKTQPLADPISFFSSKDDAPKETTDNNFNRLASYFTSPAKTDHGKSFFELSQSQNHYRHANTSIGDTTKQISKEDKNTEEPKVNLHDIPTDAYLANITLMHDLTASRNLSVSPKDQIKKVNYFTVEYDNEVELKMGAMGEPNLKQVDRENYNNDDELEECNMCDDTKVMTVVSKCKYCCNNDFFQRTITLNKVAIDADFNVRKVNDSNNPDNRTDQKPDMDQQSEDRRREVTVTFGNPLQEESEGVSTATESRATTEYSPVKHHWFYRVDVEGKSIWRGFSASDNRALEEAFVRPDLDANTVVATDGGRFDVNILGRLRTAVYWSDKPTNVRRCSWFYKGTTDARYVPYTEPVAEKLEEEYRRGVSTGEWHRRLVLSSSELVVMHGPAVMVHFPHAQDALGGSPQSTMRPRVVRRGIDESEIEDPEPSSIDHLLLLCHGVGSACDMRFRSVEEVVDDFRATSLQLLQSHYRNSYDKGVVNRVEVLPISWHATLHSGETGVDRRLATITLDSIPRLRNFTNDTVLDVLFYTSPVFCQTIIDTVCAELNRIYSLFASRNPGFSGRVSLGGHSLGSVILYDLLCHQPQESPAGSPTVKSYVEGAAGTGQATVRYPPLAFKPAAMYALGSPIAMFECIRGVKSLGTNFSLPTCKNFFNIFHPYDPIAYRIEPLIDSQMGAIKPFLIPHHKGRKRMHLELKDTMARVGADLKQKLVESLKSTWSSMWKSHEPPNDAHLEKVVEEEMEKEQLCDDTKDEVNQNNTPSPDMLGKLNGGRRVDYVLQETPFEMINEYLFAMSSHVCYWESEDTMLLILREIYDSLGVQPDCTVPQQTLTVQRTRNTGSNEAYVVSTSEYPSTSRDGT